MQQSIVNLFASKGKVFANKPHTIQELETNIKGNIVAVRTSCTPFLLYGSAWTRMTNISSTFINVNSHLTYGL